VIENSGEWQTFHCGLKDQTAVAALAKNVLNTATDKLLSLIAQSVDVPAEVTSPKS